MPKVEQISPLGLYARRGVFEKRFSEGYTETAFGVGPWIGDKRIVGMWIFYHPQNKKIATFEHPKIDTCGMTLHGNPYEAEYTPAQFEDHLKKYAISVGVRKDLGEITKIMIENFPKEEPQPVAVKPKGILARLIDYMRN